MTAPARVAGPAARTRTRTAVPQRERGTGKPAVAPDRTPGTRARSAAGDRAYTRRAQRTGRQTGVRAKVERKPGSASRVTFVLLVMGLLAVGVVATLWFATQATADAYQLQRARSATGALSVQVNRLQQQVAQQDSPPSLAQKAQQLGMVPAGDPAHLVVGADGSVTKVGVPSAAQAPAPPPAAVPNPPVPNPPASNPPASNPPVPNPPASPPVGAVLPPAGH